MIGVVAVERIGWPSNRYCSGTPSGDWTKAGTHNLPKPGYNEDVVSILLAYTLTAIANNSPKGVDAGVSPVCGQGVLLESY